MIISHVKIIAFQFSLFCTNYVLFSIYYLSGPDVCSFRISRLLVTYEVRKFPAVFIVVVLKIQMALVRI